MLFGLIPRSAACTRLSALKHLGLPTIQHRNKITMVQHDFAENVKVKRPLPIVLVQSSQDKDRKWPLRWQQKLGELGYRSSYIRLEQEEETTRLPLDVWYKDLTQAMQEHSYFPPLLIGHGDEAWKTCQKYVCNKPVSGLVLIHHGDETKLPSMEFEPHFPLCVLSPLGKVPLFLQDEHVDHIDTLHLDNESVLQHTLNWMDDANM